MAVDAKLLEILVCPEDRSALDLVELPDDVRGHLVTRYREEFKDEEPVVEQGLRCTACGRVYPIVSDIPAMRPEDAIPGVGSA